MAITISGDTGVAGVDGSASTPALQGADTNTGVRFGTDTVAIVTGGSDRVVTDASGNLLVGTTSTGSFPAAPTGVGIYRSVGNWQLLCIRNVQAGAGAVINISNAATAGIGWDFGLIPGSADFVWRYDANNRASINSSTGAYTAVSDRNLKKNFETSKIGLAEIMQIETTLFNMVDDADDAPKHLGFIAQQVKPFIPQAYVESSGFIGLQDRPILAAAIKAIQEQQTLIQDLTARLEALEAK